MQPLLSDEESILFGRVLERLNRRERSAAAYQDWTEHAEAMAHVYPPDERREWIRREMALRQRLIEHKGRRR